MNAAMPTSQAVTVVIVTYNSADVLPECLAALSEAMDGLPKWQTVVVDNASTDPSLGVVAQFAPDARRLQTGRNAGYAAGINAGLADVDPGDHVLVLNPDIRLTPGSVRRLVDTLAETGAGIVCPKLIGANGELSHSQRRDPSLLRALGETFLGGARAGRWSALGETDTVAEHYGSGRWVDWATGAALLVSSGCRAAVGAWDETFFLYSEETDYCQRARRAGFGVRYEPDAVAVHLGGDLTTSPALRRHLVRNKAALYARGHSAVGALAYRAALAANEATRAVRGSAPHRAGLAELLRSRPVPTPTSDARPGLNPGFVLFSAQDYWYHNRAHSDVQLARGIARSRPILLVNSLGMRMPVPGRHTDVARRLSRKAHSVMRAVRRPEAEFPNLRVMTPVLLPFYRSRRMRAINGRLVRWQVAAVARAMGMPAPHVMVTIPTAWDAARGMRKSSFLVNRADLFSSYPDADKAVIAGLEEQLLSHADVAFYVSRQLMDSERPSVHGEPIFLGHGVDFERFAAATREDVPAELARVPTPRVGFFGGLGAHVVDFDLLRRVADDIPEAQLVLIGDAPEPIDDLLARENVHWFAKRPYEEIPRYGAGFDVAIMPWLQNEWIEHCNPIKTKEYLALGLPVVSTYYPEVKDVADVVAVAKDSDEFIGLIRNAINGAPLSDPGSRRDRVRGDSWSARAEVIIRHADGVGQPSAPSSGS